MVNIIYAIQGNAKVHGGIAVRFKSHWGLAAF